MIAFLRGRLVDKRADEVVLDVGGVGYLVAVSPRTLTDLAGLGSTTISGEAAQTELLIYAHQPADSPLQLFGFSKPEERELFELLISVHGVGPRLAQTLLGGFAPGLLEAAIAGGEVAALKRIKGIGAKTAERVVLELKGKVHAPASASRGASVERGPAAGKPQNDLVSALVGLGYRPAEAEQAVARAARKTALEGGTSDPNALLQEALREVQAR